MTDVKLKDNEPLDEQLQMQLKKRLFSFHKSAKNFYGYSSTIGGYKSLGDYED